MESSRQRESFELTSLIPRSFVLGRRVEGGPDDVDAWFATGGQGGGSVGDGSAEVGRTGVGPAVAAAAPLCMRALFGHGTEKLCCGRPVPLYCCSDCCSRQQGAGRKCVT